MAAFAKLLHLQIALSRPLWAIRTSSRHRRMTESNSDINRGWAHPPIGG